MAFQLPSCFFDVFFDLDLPTSPNSPLHNGNALRLRNPADTFPLSGATYSFSEGFGVPMLDASNNPHGPVNMRSSRR